MHLRKPSPAMLVALLALFVALGGSSYAALTLPRNSVGGKQLKKNSVTSPKVKPGSLLLSDFRASQRSLLRGPQGPQGVQGVQGVQGLQGAKGEQGPPGSARAYIAVRTPVGDTFTIDDQKNVTGVRREPGGGPAGEFCVRVDPSTALLPDGDNLTVVVSASDAGFTASSKPFVGNGCDDDEMVISTYNPAGALADSGFSAVLP